MFVISLLARSDFKVPACHCHSGRRSACEPGPEPVSRLIIGASQARLSLSLRGLTGGGAS
eukprot:880890-Rhodomonas_salina.3